MHVYPGASMDAGAEALFTAVEPAPVGAGWREDAQEFHEAVELAPVFDGEQCDRLVRYLDKLDKVPSKVQGPDGSAVVDLKVRRARQAKLAPTPDTLWAYERLASAIDRCNREFFAFDLRDFTEQLALVDYRAGDFFDWHLDVGHGESYRKLSVSVVLSAPEDYEGGELTFPSAKFGALPRGGAVVFPSFMLHGVQPVKRGRRCALLAWIGGPSFR